MKNTSSLHSFSSKFSTGPNASLFNQLITIETNFHSKWDDFFLFFSLETIFGTSISSLLRWQGAEFFFDDWEREKKARDFVFSEKTEKITFWEFLASLILVSIQIEVQNVKKV